MGFQRDVRYALRLWARSPGVAAVAIVTLAIGISATTEIFSAVYGTFFAPLPYRQPDSLVTLWSRFRGERVPVAPRDFLQWRQRANAFSDINAWGPGSITIETAGGPASVQSGNATPGFLAMLGYGHPLTLGRTFRDDEAMPGRDRVIVLTYRFWQDAFAGDPAMVGRKVRLHGGVPYTVIGVLGEGPADRQQARVWLPLGISAGEPGDDVPFLNVVARLKPGVGVAEAHANLLAVSQSIERDRGRGLADWHASVEPYRNSSLADSTKRGLWLLLAAVAFLLLIACANVANLLLARGVARQRELAVRASIGATPGALMRQLLIESLVLAVGGGTLGVLLAVVFVEAIMALMPPFALPSEADVAIALPVLLFALAGSIAAGLAAGVAPASQVTHPSLIETLKRGSSLVGRRHALGRALVVAEFALALTLLAGGGVALHALVRMLNVDPGFRTGRLLTFALGVPDGRLPSPQRVENFHRELVTRIAVLPGVRSVALSTDMPLLRYFYGQRFTIATRPLAGDVPVPEAFVNMVSPAYFETYGIRILRGRPFTDGDTAASLPVAIVNEVFVKRYLSGVDPLTARLLMSPSPRGDGRAQPRREWHIVGVNGQTRNLGLARDAAAEISVPLWQDPWPSVTVAMHASDGAPALLPEVRRIVGAIDPDLPVDDVKTMDRVMIDTMASERFHAVMLGVFAAAALALAAVGIYGVMSFVVAQRTHEIGVRIALGARARQVTTGVLRDGMTAALAGTALGAVGAWGVGRAMRGVVDDIDTTDPVVFATVALVLLGAAFAACLVPARRASAVDPIVALRRE